MRSWRGNSKSLWCVYWHPLHSSSALLPLELPSAWLLKSSENLKCSVSHICNHFSSPYVSRREASPVYILHPLSAWQLGENLEVWTMIINLGLFFFNTSNQKLSQVQQWEALNAIGFRAEERITDWGLRDSTDPSPIPSLWKSTWLRTERISSWSWSWGANNNQKFCWKTPKSHLSSSFLQPETEPKVNFSIDLLSNLFKIVSIDKIMFCRKLPNKIQISIHFVDY